MIMGSSKMSRKVLLLESEVAAGDIIRFVYNDIATPHFCFKVLEVFMAFPVATTAKALIAFVRSAAIWSCMALHVLSQIAFELLDCTAYGTRIYCAWPPSYGLCDCQWILAFALMRTH